MQQPPEHVLSGSMAAAEALLEQPSSPAGLHSLQRIASRMHAAAVELGDDELGRVATALRAVAGWDEAKKLTEQAAGIIHRRAAQPDQSAATILIIEDDRLTARVLMDQLEEPGREVLVARHALEAQTLLRQKEISLILLDLLLPDADGRDLLVQLRNSGATRAMPILVVTARSDIPTHMECYALGADGLLVKPVARSLLRSAVAALLHHAAERRIEGRHDRLTGLANRVAFMEALQRARPLVRRHRSPLAVAMLDLDHFKGVNDQYGHGMGDEVLRQTARTIAKSLRLSDVVARWGGEEFCVYFPDTDGPGAIIALYKALEAVRELRFNPEGAQPFGVTFSAGVALLQHDESVEQTLAEADRLLYLAKAAGRNRIMSAANEIAAPRPVILLVEDDDAVAQMVKLVLQREGYDVLRFQNGSDALAAIDQHEFVLALLDVNLPGVTGFDVVSGIRQRWQLAKLPIIMLTGSTEEENVVHGFELGISDYVTKPFYATELVARIKRLLKH
ncbi:MAG: response regulator [Gemmatimonadota bacterium]